MQTERRGHYPNRALIASTADACEQAASKASLLLLTLQRASSSFHFSEISNPPTFGGTVIPLWQHQSTQHEHSNFKISVVEAKPQKAAAMIRDEVDQIHRLDQIR